MSREWPERVEIEWLTEQEIRESGLLAYVNRALLWPIGLALAVTMENDEYLPGLRIQRNVPFDPIVGDGGSTSEEVEAQMRHFAEWLAERVR